MIAGGVESMSRAPSSCPRPSRLQPQQCRVRHHHRLALHQQADEAQYGVDSMPETAENVADDFKIEREAQDRMALASQQRPPPPSLPATWPGIVPVSIPRRRATPSS
jgi:acetyl-CoA C-acetyltransferase